MPVRKIRTTVPKVRFAETRRVLLQVGTDGLSQLVSNTSTTSYHSSCTGGVQLESGFLMSLTISSLEDGRGYDRVNPLSRYSVG